MNAQLPGGERERSRLLWLMVVFAILLGVLSWLFMRAEEISPEVHYEYLQSLRRIQQADVELNSAVLASHAGLLRNYDPLVRHVNEIRAEEAALRRIPSTLPAEALTQLRPLVERLPPAR